MFFLSRQTLFPHCSHFYMVLWIHHLYSLSLISLLLLRERRIREVCCCCRCCCRCCLTRYCRNRHPVCPQAAAFLHPPSSTNAAVSRTDDGRRRKSLAGSGRGSFIVSPGKRRSCCFSPGFSFILDTCWGKQFLSRIDSWIYSRTGCGGESHLETRLSAPGWTQERWNKRTQACFLLGVCSSARCESHGGHGQSRPSTSPVL